MTSPWEWDVEDVIDALSECPCMAYHSHGYCICEDDREATVPQGQYLRIVLDEINEVDWSARTRYERLAEKAGVDVDE